MRNIRSHEHESLDPGTDHSAMIHLADGSLTGIVGATRREFDSWPSTRAAPHVNARATAPHGTLAH